MLSTPEPMSGTKKNDNCYKLALYKLYDFTKGGTDIVDQRMGFHTTKTKSKKWTLGMFAYVVDTARVNSLTIFTLNQGKDPIKEKSFKCTHQLVVKLVKPTIEMRNQVFLASKIKQKIALVLDRPLLQPELHQMMDLLLVLLEKGVICIRWQLLEKATLESSIPCVKTLCQSCGNVTCQEHMLRKYLSCANNHAI